MNKLITKLLMGVLFVLGAVGAEAQNVAVTGADPATNAGSPFATLSAAFVSINAASQAGNTIVITIIGNTTEPAGGAILNESAGAWTSLSIQPSGGLARTIAGAATAGGPLINFNGADNVTVDGLNAGGNSLTIENTTVSATSNTSTIRFIGGATNNTITRCSLKGSGTMSVATNGAVVFFSTDAVTANGNDNNTISNCDIGPSGANLPTKAILGNGSTTTTAIGNSGIIIDNNDIHDYFGAAVTSAGIATNGGCNTWTITNNRFYQTGTRTWTTGALHNAMLIGNTSSTSGAQGFTITGNIVGYASNTQTGTYTLTGSSGSFRGIVFNGITLGTSSTISSNTIASISVTGVTSSGTSSSAPFMGIYITNGVVTSNSNTIGSQSATGSLVYSTTSASAADMMGMFNFSSDAWTVNNNTIGGLTSSNSGAGAANAYGIRLNTGSAVTTTMTGNTVGGTVVNSIQSTSTATGTQVAGIFVSTSIATLSNNTIRNLTAAGGTGTTTAASVVGIAFISATPVNNAAQNTIFNLNNTNATAATIVTGIQFTGGTGNVVERNFIHNLTSSTTSTTAEINGIRVAGGTTIYRNNMIAIGAGVTNAIGTAATNSNTSGVNGINEALGTNSFFHNSVYIGGAPTAGVGASYAFNGTQTVNTRSFRDNIFFNARSNSGATGSNYAVKINGTAPNPAGLTINNNVYFANGTGAVFGFFNSLNVANLTAWKTAVGQDASSFESNPEYNDPTNATPDLHLHPTNLTLAEGTGADVGVTLDYDGQTRATLTPVDIGADAGNFTGAPPMVFVSSTTTQANTSNVNTNTINQEVIGIEIVTTGSTNALSATDFTINITGTTNAADIANAKIFYTGTSSTFAATNQFGSAVAVPVGSHVIAGTQILSEGTNYFWLTYDVICGATAGNLIDGECTALTVGAAQIPTVTAPAGTRTIVTGPLSGTYTVGGGGAYATLTAAAAAVNTNGLSGNITFEILNSITEAGAVTINQWAECGGSGFTLTIKPAAATTPTISTALTTGAFIILNGADRVTIDGSNNGTSSRDLTITHPGITAPAVISIVSLGTGLGATDNTVKNCNINSGVNTTAGYGIAIGGATIGTSGADNDNNTIQNNVISESTFGIHALGTTNVSTGGMDNLTVTGNSVSYNNALAGGIAIRVGNTLGTTINQNTISIETSSNTALGISLETGTTNTTVTRNLISKVRSTTTTGLPVVRGIAVGTGQTGSSISISNNVIYNVISFYSTSNAASNNMGIIIGAVGLSTTTTNTTGGVNLYYNSINLYGNVNRNTACFQYGLFIGSASSSLDFRNNVIVNSILNINASAGASKSYAIYSLAANTAFSNINYNDYYASGSQGVTGFLTSDRTTLADIQAGFGQNVNSLVADPLFNSNTNLVPQTGSPLTAVGDNSTGITIDYNGVTRTNPPTIGAYDVPGDAMGPDITYTPLVSTCTLGARTLSAVITDALSGVPIAGPGLPVLYWRINAGAWTPVTAIHMGGSNYDFTFGAGAVVNDVVQYYIVAQDGAATPNVSAFPAAGAGGFTINPPAAATPPTTPSSYTIQTVLAAGTYTVGTLGVYPTLTAAVAAYNTSCLGGPIVFELLDAAYTPFAGGGGTSSGVGETFPIVINNNGDASSINTLTIRPAAAVTASFIAAVSAGPVIRILGNFVTIDGSNNGSASRDLTITNTSVTTPNVILIGSTGTTPITNVTVKNSILINGVNTSSNLVVSDATTLGNDGYFNNITLQNNDIRIAFIGMYLRSAVLAGNGSGTLVTGNTLNNSGANAIRLCGIYLQGVDGATVSNNTVGNLDNITAENDAGIWLATGVSNTTLSGNTISTLGMIGTGAFAPIGINITSGVAASNIVVTQNSISDITTGAGATTQVSGISITGTTGGVTLQRNNIQGINNQSILTYGAYGINSSGGNNNIIRNNFISNITGDMTDGGAFSTTFGIFGLRIGAGTGHQVYHNSVNMYGARAGVANSSLLTAAFGLVSTASTGCDVRNNIFANNISGGTTSVANVSVYLPSGGTTAMNLTWNNNAYYSGTDASRQGIGQAGTTAGTNFYLNSNFNPGSTTPSSNLRSYTSALLVANTNNDNASRGSTGAVPFTTNNDLHLTPANAELKSGTPIGSVPADFDGDTRSLTNPVMGADERSFPDLWSGAVSTVWDAVTTGNWDDGVVPAAGNSVTIPAGVPNMPAIAGVTTVNNITFTGNGATLSLNGQNLQVGGTITGAGTLTGSSTSDLNMGGTTTINFTQTNASTRSLNNFTLQGATANVTLGNALDVFGTIQLVTGATLNMAGQAVTLKSNATNTARIADLTGQTLTGATNVTMERFIKLRLGGTGRAYRLLTPTVNTTGSMNANWMEGAMNTAIGTNIDPVPGFGTQITGAGGNANGFDKTQTNQSSIYATANAVTPTYTPIANSTGTLNALTGYFMYIRGDRSMDMQIPLAVGMPTSATTLRATGTVLQGPQTTFTNAYVGGGALNLVTNPYPSAIDWSLVQPASSGITGSYTYWDANIGTRGGFATVTTAGVSTPATSATQFIQSGQAFFVESDGSVPAVSIQETHKSASNNNGVFLVPPPPVESFRTELYFTEPNGFRRVADGAIAVYDNKYSAAVDANDAKEINNWDENIAIARDGKRLAIETRPVIGKSDDLPIFMNNMKQQAYEFEFTPLVFTNTNLKAELVDNFLGTRTLLSVTAPTVVSFTITADAASKASDRFKVVFGQFGNPTGVDAITIKASQKNGGVQVDWTAKTETDMVRYEVEKSTYGTTFAKVNTTSAIGNSNTPVDYNWFDTNPNMGTNFYRIKGIDKAGNVRYSDMVRVLFGKGEPSIVVYPNPVQGKTFKMDMYNLVKGTYVLNLYSNDGRLVYTQQLQHDGSQVTRTINLNGDIPQGSYQLQLMNGNGFKTSKILIKN